ncbi:RKD1-like protein [Tanacetum coccineum]
METKDFKISKSKKDKYKSLALKSKKESSDEETSTSGSEDENTPWRDSEEEEELKKDGFCLMAHESNENQDMSPNPLEFSLSDIGCNSCYDNNGFESDNFMDVILNDHYHMRYTDESMSCVYGIENGFDTNVVGENMMNIQKRNHNEDMKVDNAKVDNASLRNMLSRETISKYFYMPITQAAKELNIGLTMLKKRCRDLGIRRWSRRKQMSLQTLQRLIPKSRQRFFSIVNPIFSSFAACMIGM